MYFKTLYIIETIPHFEKPIKEALNEEMTIKTREVNLNTKVVGIFLPPSTVIIPVFEVFQFIIARQLFNDLASFDVRSYNLLLDRHEPHRWCDSDWD
jgi:hypothetical protein